MKKLKEECKYDKKGITLIALVITIIVLLILAGVTIATLTGDNGILTQASKAEVETRGGAVQEARDLWESNKALDDATNSSSAQTLDELLADLEEQKLLTSEEVAEVKETGQVTIGSRTIVFGTGETTLVEAFNAGEIKVGDYVNYTPEAHEPITVGTSETGYTDSQEISGGTNQTFSQNANTTWRVLGLGKDGQNLLLTSGSPIKKDGDDPYLVLESYIGVDNCVNVLNKISSLYHNSNLADETRSMTIEDIENVLGGITVTYPEEGEYGTVTLNADKSKTNIGETTNYPSYTYPSGEYTLTNPPQSATAGNSVEADAYAFGYDYDAYQELGINIDQRTYDMLFKDTTKDSNYAKSYWLASPGVFAYSYVAYFGPGAVGGGRAGSAGNNLFNSIGNWGAYGMAVRPVVVLKSNITVEQIQVIEDQTEETWSTTGANEYGRGSLSS